MEVKNSFKETASHAAWMMLYNAAACHSRRKTIRWLESQYVVTIILRQAENVQGPLSVPSAISDSFL